MKVNQVNQISQVYKASSVKKIEQGNDKSKVKDNLKISETAKCFQIAYKAAKNEPDVRTEKIEKIKDKLNSGTYNVSAEEVAKKMLPIIFDKMV